MFCFAALGWKMRALYIEQVAIYTLFGELSLDANAGVVAGEGT